MLPPSFSFRQPTRYTASTRRESPRPSRRLASSEAASSHTSEMPILPPCRIPIRISPAGFPCDTAKRKAEPKQLGSFGKPVTQNVSRLDIDYGTGGIRFYQFPDSRYRFSRRSAILLTTSSSSNPSTHPTANPAASPIEPATTHWTTA